jgi:hypothetical protein
MLSMMVAFRAAMTRPGEIQLPPPPSQQQADKPSR